MEFGGDYEISLMGDSSIHFRGDRQKIPEKALILIGFLAFEPEFSASRAKIRQVLWGDNLNSKPSANLRQLLSRIRKIQKKNSVNFLSELNGDLQIEVTNVKVDVIEMLFKPRMALDGGGSSNSVCEASNIESVFLERISEDLNENLEDWLRDKRRLMLETQISRALRTIEELDIERSSEVILALAGWIVSQDPTRESAHQSIIACHLARGQVDAAAKAYWMCHGNMAAELGVEPSLETRRIVETIIPTQSTSTVFSGADVPAVPNMPRTSDQLHPNLSALGEPRILMLPPHHILLDPIFQRISVGLVEDVTVGLSRFRSFAVISPNTAHAVSEMGHDAHKAQLSNGIEYLVTTMLKPVRGKTYITFSLKQIQTGGVIWATEYELRLDAISDIYNQISEIVVNSIASEIEKNEISLPLAPADSSSYRLYLEAKQFLKGHDLPDIRRARKWFLNSLKRTGTFAPSVVGFSRTLTLEWLVRGESDTELLLEAQRNAARAAELDNFSGQAQRELGFSSLYLRRHDDSLSSFDRALFLSPNDADCNADYADALAHSGHPIEAMHFINRAFELNPYGPDFYYWVLGSIYFQLEDFSRAIDALKEVEGNPASARLLAACYAMSGDSLNASVYSQRVLENYPSFLSKDLFKIVPNKNRVDTERLVNGLRAAGLK